MKKEIAILEIPELESIEKSKADQIRATFAPMVQMLKSFEKAFSEIIKESEKEITNEITSKAKRLRLDIGKVRIKAEKLRIDQKAEYLRAGQAIDGVNNILKWAVVEKENRLKEIEDYFEIQERARLEKLQNERAEKLSLYVEDAYDRALSILADDEFDALLTVKKQQYNDRIAAEKKAEEDRIAKEKAEAEERERIRIENERLKKEAEEREKKAEIERKKREAEDRIRKEKEEKERLEIEAQRQKERAEYESKIKAEQEEMERVAKIEREKREKAESELKAKIQAEEKAKKEADELLQNELKKNDAEKIASLITDLNLLKTKYEFKSAKYKKMYLNVGQYFDKVIEYIESNN